MRADDFTPADQQGCRAMAPATHDDNDPRRWYPTSPVRAPDWRLRLARRLVAHPGPPPALPADAWVARALRHLTAHAGGEHSPRRPDRAVAAALALAADAPRRADLEAALLAGLGHRGAAADAGIPVSHAEAFARLVFDLEGHLGDKPAVDRAIALEPDPRVRALKRFAYIGGPDALTAARAVLRGAAVPARLLAHPTRPPAEVEHHLRLLVAQFVAAAAGDTATVNAIQAELMLLGPYAPVPVPAAPRPAPARAPRPRRSRPDPTFQLVDFLAEGRRRRARPAEGVTHG
jgi:hypothetical protein